MTGTVIQGLALAKSLLHTSQPDLAWLLWKTNLLETNLFGHVSPNAAVFFVQLILMLAVVFFHEGDLLAAQGWHPVHDFLVRTTALKIGHQILYGNPARRKLQTTTSIDQGNLFFHAGILH